MTVEVIDNFLDPKTFKEMQKVFLSIHFPWYVYTGVSGIKKVNKDHWSFFHLLYQNVQPNSDFFKKVDPLLDALEIYALHRIKANLYPKTEKIVEHDLHWDLEMEHKGALFCLNNNDGYTHMESGEKIESVENRIILFDPSKLHGSTTCTNANYRVNIIVNYF
jgi:hypothetical protein